MEEIYNILFNDLEFESVRNEIFKKLNSDIHNYLAKIKYKGPNDFFNKFKIYQESKPNITYCNFKFVIEGNNIVFFHKDYISYKFKITNLKQVQISKNSDGSEAKNEWIFNDEYLKYLVNKIYDMKNPKFAHSLKSINDESSIISLKEENIKDYLNKDWNIIYEAEKAINYDNILEEKKKIVKEGIKDDFLIRLIRKNDMTELPKDFFKFEGYCSSLDDIFPLKKPVNKKNIIFHNEDIYFRYNLFRELYMYYNYGMYGNFYINFKLLNGSTKRHEKLEKIVYFLSFLFPYDYPDFNKFFEEKIKYEISDDIYCWKEIISEIINYFQDNVFSKTKQVGKRENPEKKEISIKIKIQKSDKNLGAKRNSKKIDKSNILSEKTHLFNDIENKKFIIIFDDITTYEENQVIENIINNCYNSNIIFFIIYPLENEFTSNTLIEYVNNPYDSFRPFSFNFANLMNFENKSSNNNEKKVKTILKNYKINDEQVFYDLIRIFNFKDIFHDSINSKTNSKSLKFLTKYIEYLNINFDNKDKKIIDITFKNQNIEEEFKERYDSILTLIRTKNNISFDNIIGQMDGFDLEKIIISEIIYNPKQNFEILKVKSIFGLRELMKKENVDYKNTNFFIKQKSRTGEMFDFAFKIVKEDKQYLKIGQATSVKTEDEKEKLSIEKIQINCSYLKNEIKKNQLGDIDGFSFCIIAPLRIIKENNKNYKNLKKFCRENNYEFILFDLNTCLFYERIKGNSIKKDIFEIDDKYQLNIKDLNEIIQINNSLSILSLRKVKERNEDDEDEKAKKKAKKYIKQNIKKIAKFEYTGNFKDLKKLDKNYFANIYWQNIISVYFYNDKIINNDEIENYDQFSNLRLNLILYSKRKINKNYIDSSMEFEIDKNEEEEEEDDDEQKISLNKIIKKKEKKRQKKTKKRKEERIEIDEDKESEVDKEDEPKFSKKRNTKKRRENAIKKPKKRRKPKKKKIDEMKDEKLDVKNLSKNEKEKNNKKLLGKKTKLLNKKY